MAKTDNNLSPKASSLYNRLFDSLLAQADSANWDYKNPSVQALSAIVLNDNNLITGPNSYIDGGATPEEIEARSAVYLSTIQKASQAVDTLIHTDIGQYNQYKELSSSVLEAVSAEDESQIQNLLPEIIAQTETVTPVEISKDTVLIETSPLTSSSIDSVSLAYFNRYQQVLNSIVQDGSIDFEPQTIEDMKAYGIDEPSIINPMTFAGQDFYGFMTSPESVDLVRQGIIENIDVADQARQLEILDLLKIDADRMVREYPREMDGPIAHAQTLHLAFASTVNPNGREEVLDAIGSNHETADRLADGIIMSMPEIKLTENFTSAVEIDPTIPKPDVASVISNAPLLSSIAGSDSLPNTDITTPPAPQEDVVLASVEAATPESTDYEIQEGDMLSKIVAEHYGLTEWSDIQRVYETVARNNGIEDPDLIHTGNNLVLFDNPAVELFPEKLSAVASSQYAPAFNASAEGLVAANSPEAPTIRPVARPLELGLTG